MKDQDKTKEELINELEELRQRIAKLEGSLVTLKQQQQPSPALGMITDSPRAGRTGRDPERERNKI